MLYGSFSRFSYWFPTDEALAAFFGYVEQAWGTGRSKLKCLRKILGYLMTM